MNLHVAIEYSFTKKEKSGIVNYFLYRIFRNKVFFKVFGIGLFVKWCVEEYHSPLISFLGSPTKKNSQNRIK